jgi:dTDP-4-amino-4,6-dideoxygalactose transaminase
MFYLVCENLEQRTALIEKLKKDNILSVFHYISLHKSPFYEKKHDGRALQNADRYTNCLVRLPMFYELNPQSIIETIIN